jgi:hypothetical protein
MFKKIIFTFLLWFLFFLFWNLSFVNAWDDLTNSSYMIDTTDMWMWWENIKKETSIETTQNFLSILVTKMMVAFWVLSVFIMTIWAWYMIFAWWQDDILSKWKSIFNAWIIALLVALSSGLLVKLVIYLLYN